MLIRTRLMVRQVLQGNLEPSKQPVERMITAAQWSSGGYSRSVAMPASLQAAEAR
jgi:hypothetical protein